ncbi:MAG: type II secretion system GspH family protein [Oscillospiraceae bacterium]|nr:type II secretion system GspH family protein [Oscillospiraceae bacterium]
MIKKLQALKAKKGFTLVELLVVIAIIGILAAVLIPLMSSFLRGARISNAETTARTASTAIDTWLKAEILNRNKGMLAGGFDEFRYIGAAAGGWALDAGTGATGARWHNNYGATAAVIETTVNAAMLAVVTDAYPNPNNDMGYLIIRIERGLAGSWNSEGDVAVCFLPGAPTAAQAASVTTVALNAVANSTADRFAGVSGGRLLLANNTNVVAGCFPAQ